MKFLVRFEKEFEIENCISTECSQCSLSVVDKDNITRLRSFSKFVNQTTKFLVNMKP